MCRKLRRRKGARKATVAGLRNHERDVLLRGAWCVAYWQSIEYTGSLDDVGFSPAMASADALVPRPSGTNRVMPSEQARSVSKFFAGEAREVDTVV